MEGLFRFVMTAKLEVLADDDQIHIISKMCLSNDRDGGAYGIPEFH